jgi:hypothetical protein
MHAGLSPSATRDTVGFPMREDTGFFPRCPGATSTALPTQYLKRFGAMLGAAGRQARGMHCVSRPDTEPTLTERTTQWICISTSTAP